MEIKLEFCVVWNYTPRAVGTIEDILEVYGNKVTSINLIPSGGGVFEFHLNNQLLFSKKELGRHTEDGEILKLIEEALDWSYLLTLHFFNYF